MRNPIELDYMLENAVAAALGVARPHPQVPRKLRVPHRKPARRAHRSTIAARRIAARAAA